MSSAAPVSFRRLTDADRPAVAALLAHDGGYAERVDGRPAGAADVDELLADRPDGIDAEKQSWGLFAGRTLVGVVDVLLGWPTPHHAYVGLLQVDSRHQGAGWGHRAHALALDEIRRWPGVTRVRLAVVDTNRGVLPFWEALGYAPTGERKRWTSPSGQAHEVDILERSLGVVRRSGGSGPPSGRRVTGSWAARSRGEAGLRAPRPGGRIDA